MLQAQTEELVSYAEGEEEIKSDMKRKLWSILSGKAEWGKVGWG